MKQLIMIRGGGELATGIAHRLYNCGYKVLMLEQPGASAELFEQYGVDYAYVSSHERAAFLVDEAWFEENCEAVFREGDVTVYRLG